MINPLESEDHGRLFQKTTTSTGTLHIAPFNIISKTFIILSYKQSDLFYISNYKQCL